jgi:hypothetical protein
MRLVRVGPELKLNTLEPERQPEPQPSRIIHHRDEGEVARICCDASWHESVESCILAMLHFLFLFKNFNIT